VKLVYTALILLISAEVYNSIVISDLRSEVRSLKNTKSERSDKLNLPEWYDRPELLIGSNLAEILKANIGRPIQLPLIRSVKFQMGSFPSWTYYATTRNGEQILTVEEGIIIKIQPILHYQDERSTWPNNTW
jgi:hypothetical protein